MVTVLKAEGSGVGGGTQVLSANVRKTIQYIKEIVRNHSDTEIYHTLRESNMDPNETTQKLLNQDPFHEVKRKRDKRKENTGFNGVLEPRRQSENPSNPPRFNNVVRNVRNGRRGGFVRNNLPARTDAGVSREFRVVRDNRVSQISDGDSQPASASNNPASVTKVMEKSGIGASNHKHSGGKYIHQNRNGMTGFQRDFNRGFNSNQHKEEYNKQKSTASSSTAQPQTVKPACSQSETPRPASSSSTVGVYASALDPVHVPSPDSRSPSVGAIQRDVGVVGIRKPSSQPSRTGPNTVRGSADTVGSFYPASAVTENGQPGKSTMNDNAVLNTNRAPFAQHQGGRQHQQPIGHQKGNFVSKEWKPKTSQKSNISDPGVIGTPLKSSSHAQDSQNQQSEMDPLQDKLLQVDINGTQNVIIAQHIRVPENDRGRLTFGSFGTELDSSTNSALAPQVAGIDSAGVSTSDNGSGSKIEDQVRTSGSTTPSDVASEKKESLNNDNIDGYADVGIVHGNNPSIAASESQHHQDPQEPPNFSAYDPQTGYDMPYFRPAVNDAIRGQNLPSQQEALASHSANSIPASSIAMMHQPPQMMAQMYPQQVHVSHFANVMPYRQYLSPVYVPPVGLPGYSNPASPYSHPHPSNGSGYVVMQGGSSQHHLAPNGSVKYGVQQFKHVPGGNAPAAFGNYGGAPTGYAMSAAPPGVVAGGASGLEDSSRMKYKDNNLYVPNPQAETSEVWIQNPRDIPGMQSSPYYNMQGQAAHPGAAFMPSHAATGHASFNPSQSSHMQFQGVYHAPPQPGPVPNPHHLGGPVAGNVGVGPGGTGAAQVGAYQQGPQLGHMNWTGNF